MAGIGGGGASNTVDAETTGQQLHLLEGEGRAGFRHRSEASPGAAG